MHRYINGLVSEFTINKDKNECYAGKQTKEIGLQMAGRT